VKDFMNSKATGRDIILAVLENMRESAEPLLYRTLVPSHYDVYLHTDDYARLSGIFAGIREECIDALDKELAGLGKKGFSLLPGLKSGSSKFEAAEKNWAVEFHQDEDEELSPGDILIDSRLALPPPVEIGAGTKTQRIKTVRSGGETRRLQKFQQEPPNADATPVAKLIYKDQDGSEHEYLMRAAEISVGRGGQTEFCDLVLSGPSDISRRHFYLRLDKETKEFFIQDVGKFGTSVDGKKLAPKEWIRLSARAVITLADRMTLEFQQL
jgi:hypothetical protein